ncbi:unknown [Bacteroides ovatus CAG:22]|nr:unknown [Bacteroides ovatus CAG:22]
MILTLAYSARRESKVVKAPAPANRGKTSGTKVASLIGPWFLKISISRIISKDIRKMTNAPATANDSIST